MLIQLWTRNDESGLLDGESRDGDIQATKDDADQVGLGGIEKKTFLFIKVPDPPNMQAFRDELGQPEYLPPASAGEPSPVRYKSKYRIDWRLKFTAAEIALIESVQETLPDGPTSAGGNVVAGVVEDLFTVADILRK